MTNEPEQDESKGDEQVNPQITQIGTDYFRRK